MGKKNEAAVALAQMRMKKLTPEERSEIARKGGEALRDKMTAKQRSASARNAGLAGGRGRPKPKPKPDAGRKATAKKAAPPAALKTTTRGVRKPPVTAKRSKNPAR